jgi:hypothetical protein
VRWIHYEVTDSGHIVENIMFQYEGIARSKGESGAKAITFQCERGFMFQREGFISCQSYLSAAPLQHVRTKMDLPRRRIRRQLHLRNSVQMHYIRTVGYSHRAEPGPYSRQP